MESTEIEKFETRKRDHIRFALDSNHQAAGLGGFDAVELVHNALPELDFEEVSLETECFGHALGAPLYVAGMTAGHADAAAINRELARACAARGWAMGVGSQRRELESLVGGSEVPEAVDRWGELRREAPDLVLFANLGLSQVIPQAVRRSGAIERLVQRLGASALVIHLNPLQEALQPEGTPRFKGGLEAISEICDRVELPVIVKETGSGMSADVLGRLAEAGVSAVDVSGLGGTHWGRIEGTRSGSGSLQDRAARTFAAWGVPTVESVRLAAGTLPGDTEIWGSGGVRTGLDAAKLIALGAHRVGYAQPALKAATDGTLDQWMEQQEFELKVAMFCTGCRAPGEMRKKEGIWKTKTP